MENEKEALLKLRADRVLVEIAETLGRYNLRIKDGTDIELQVKVEELEKDNYYKDPEIRIRGKFANKLADKSNERFKRYFG